MNNHENDSSIKSKNQKHIKTKNPRFLLSSILLSLSILLVYLLISSFLWLPTSLSISQSCKMSRMRPSYVSHSIQLSNFLSSSSQSSSSTSIPITSKYSLYLYRERFPGKGKSDDDEPDTKNGLPALFVPGNSGSYGQVRSVASSSARQFWKVDRQGQRIGEKNQEWKQDGREIDWWTIDFNEDFSAFHGPTLQLQSLYLNDVLKYLIHLYSNSQSPSSTSSITNSTKVLLLAHSMGGLTSKLSFLQPNHPQNSVDTLITLSTPLEFPPLSLSRDVQKAYTQIDKAFESKEGSEDLLQISIAGGLLDNQISSDSALVGKSGFLKEVTSLVPGLWSSVDHLAVMWCDQLRSRIARGGIWNGMTMVNGTGYGPDGEGDLNRRRELWRKTLGIGKDEEQVENWEVLKEILGNANGIQEIIDEIQGSELENVNRFRKEEKDGRNSKILFSIKHFESSSSSKVSFLTNLNVGPDPISGIGIYGFQIPEISVSICRNTSSQDSSSSIQCHSIPSHLYSLLPPSPILKVSTNEEREKNFPDPSVGYGTDPKAAIYEIELQLEELKKEGLGWILIESKGQMKARGGDKGMYEITGGDGWFHLAERETDVKVLNESPLRLGGIYVPFSQQKQVLQSFRLSKMDTSLLSYNIELVNSACSQAANPNEKLNFGTMVKAVHKGSGDGKWFVSITSLFDPSSTSTPNPETSLSLSGSTPFILPAEASISGTTFSVYMDSIENGDKGVCSPFDGMRIKVDWGNSLGGVFMRYRTFLIGFPVGLIGMSGVEIWRGWDQDGVFVSPLLSILLLPFQNLPRFGLLTLLLATVQHLLISSFSPNLSTTSRFLQDLFAGYIPTPSILTILIGPFLLFLAWGVLFLEALGTSVSIEVAAWLIKFIGLKSSLAFENSNAPAASKKTSSPRFSNQTTLTILGLLLLTFTIIPHQFVFLVTVLIQYLNTLRARLALNSTSSFSSVGLNHSKGLQEDQKNEYRALRSEEDSESVSKSSSKSTSKSKPQSSSQSRFFFNLYLLLFLLILLPFKAPALLVWARNLMILFTKIKPKNYAELKVGMGLGGEDHEAFRVLGNVLLVQVAAGGRGIGRAVTRLESKITQFGFMTLILTSLAFGIRHTYRIFDVFNLLACWFLIVQYRSRKDDRVFSPTSFSTGMVNRGDTRNSVDEMRVDGEGVLRLSIPEELSGGNTSSTPQHQTESQTHQTQSTPGSITKASNSGISAQLDQALETYLKTLDLYTSSQEKIADSFTKGFLDLSRGKMALATSSGGMWRGASLVHDMWDARMKSNWKVNVDDRREEEGLRFGLMKLELETPKQAELKEANLRRRKGVKEEEKSEAREKDKGDDEEEKQPPIPPNPLYQFGGLPPAKLRSSQTHFQQSIRTMLVGESGEDSLINLKLRLEELEEEIGNLRERAGQEL